MFGRLWRAGAVVAALAVIAVVIWVDVMTPVWQNLVIVSGLVAGVVTFLFTTLFIDRFIQRAARRRWAPVTRLALTEMLNQLADEGQCREGQSSAQGAPSRVYSRSRTRHTVRALCWPGPRSCAVRSCASAGAYPQHW